MIRLFKYIYIIILISICIGELQSQYLIRGSISFSDNGAPAKNDKVYIIRYDYDQSIVHYIDSTIADINGNFNIQTAFNDSLLICCSENQPINNEDHVTTYYQSTIDWTQALQIYPPDNPVNINIVVQRIIPADDSYSFSGKIVTLDINNNLCPLVGAIVVAKQDTIFTGTTVTDVNGNYTIDSLTLGSAIIYVTKIGYCLDSSGIIVGGNSINHSIMQLRKVRVRGSHSNNKIINTFKLYQNYPNPFNPVTVIKFKINQSGFVSLKIYDILGCQVSILMNSFLKPGNYEIEWNGSDYSSGIYFYELRNNHFKDVKIMNLIK